MVHRKYNGVNEQFQVFKFQIAKYNHVTCTISPWGVLIKCTVAVLLLIFDVPLYSIFKQ